MSARAGLALAALVLAAGCGPKRLPPARADASARLTERQRRGEVVYARHCQSCHPGGGAGLGPSILDKPAPQGAIKLQVRQGLGAMPAFDAAKIPDEDLDALADYVVRLRSR